MLQPLRLGNKIFPINIIQGPLAGISCAPFRYLTWKYGQPAFSCSEMIACKTILHASYALQQRFISKHPAEGPVCFQLASSEPLELAEATQRVTAAGADLIDLNCGCPVKKIRRKGAGSSLLLNPTKLYQLICAMKRNTHVPVSVKIRVEGRSQEKFNAELAQVINDAGADFLIVHGRHWTERYDVACQHEQIKFFVAAVKVPVIGNGDIHDLTSLKEMFATGCAGVMLARAGVGQPWLIRKLIAELKEEKFIPPSVPEIGAVFIEHVLQLCEFLGNERPALQQARQFGKYYARNIKQRSEFCLALNACEDLVTLKNICARYFNLSLA